MLTTAVPEIKDGYMTIPTGPGWGADINEEVARAHPWNPTRVGYAKSTPPPRSF
jgi:L-alanine-DL-glutamate epimerase-like enolase superfamily enzyme